MAKKHKRLDPTNLEREIAALETQIEDVYRAILLDNALPVKDMRFGAILVTLTDYISKHGPAQLAEGITRLGFEDGITAAGLAILIAIDTDPALRAPKRMLARWDSGNDPARLEDYKTLLRGIIPSGGIAITNLDGRVEHWTRGPRLQGQEAGR